MKHNKSISSLKSFCFQEGKTVKAMSGFGGKGFKFDETEAQLVSERKKLQKAALGLEDSDDEDPSMDVSTVLHYQNMLLDTDFSYSSKN